MHADARSIVAVIRMLESENPKERARSRSELEEIGRPATWHLIQAVYPTGDTTRHEALKVLVSLADPAAADLFTELLQDEDSECRWLAAEGLAALGEEGLLRALKLALELPRTEHAHRALHHVLSALRKSGFDQIVGPVLRAFQSAVREAELPKAAHEALNKLRRARHAQPG